MVLFCLMRCVMVWASCTFLEMLLYLQIKGRDWHVICMRKSEIGKFVGTLENLGTDRCRRIVVDGKEMLKWKSYYYAVDWIQWPKVECCEHNS
jgi:hypothetical protein